MTLNMFCLLLLVSSVVFNSRKKILLRACLSAPQCTSFIPLSSYWFVRQFVVKLNLVSWLKHYR